MKIPATWTERDLITSATTSSTSSTSTKAKKNKPQQCLRFAATIEVAEIPNRFDYSREELEDCWFQGYDYEEFRENSYMTMGLYRAGLLPANIPNDKHCMRGLEGRLQEASKEREWTRYHATAAVLNEQYRQHRMGYRNPQAIADLYHSVAWNAQYKAYTQAMLDEQEQRSTTTTTTYNKAAVSPRRSEPKNLLRRVIDIERSDMDSSCSMQSSLLQPATDFDITSFLQELTVPAQ
jgi:predicted RNase H-like HicB family nuclease